MRGAVGQTLYDSTHTRHHVKEELGRGSVHRAGNGPERAWAADPQSTGSDSKHQCQGKDRMCGVPLTLQPSLLYSRFTRSQTLAI